MTQFCRFEMRRGNLNGIPDALGVLRCSALADTTGYCPVHSKPAPDVPKRALRPKVDMDADVLPWGETWPR